MRINIWGGPGTGKSTTAAWLFSELKQRGINIELVTEYIKAWAWEKRVPSSYDQVYIFAKQLRNEDLLTRQGVHLVTDSPLPLQLVYIKRCHRRYYDELLGLCRKFDDEHPAFNVLLRRTVPFQPFGRYETLEEAAEIDTEMAHLLQTYDQTVLLCDPDKDKEKLLKAALKVLT